MNRLITQTNNDVYMDHQWCAVRSIIHSVTRSFVCQSIYNYNLLPSSSQKFTTSVKSKIDEWKEIVAWIYGIWASWYQQEEYTMEWRLLTNFWWPEVFRKENEFRRKILVGLGRRRKSTLISQECSSSLFCLIKIWQKMVLYWYSRITVSVCTFLLVDRHLLTSFYFVLKYESFRRKWRKWKL